MSDMNGPVTAGGTSRVIFQWSAATTYLRRRRRAAALQVDGCTASSFSRRLDIKEAIHHAPAVLNLRASPSAASLAVARRIGVCHGLHGFRFSQTAVERLPSPIPAKAVAGKGVSKLTYFVSREKPDLNQTDQ